MPTVAVGSVTYDGAADEEVRGQRGDRDREVLGDRAGQDVAGDVANGVGPVFSSVT